MTVTELNTFTSDISPSLPNGILKHYSIVAFLFLISSGYHFTRNTLSFQDFLFVPRKLCAIGREIITWLIRKGYGITYYNKTYVHVYTKLVGSPSSNPHQPLMKEKRVPKTETINVQSLQLKFTYFWNHLYKIFIYFM